jgi:DDE superfamily endonuclease
MEDVLDLYAAPPDPRRPLVCFDELPYQLVSETRTPRPARPGRVARYDYEYHREGTANLFLHVAPHLGWRQVAVTERRTARDFAHQMKALVDEPFPAAEVIRLVSDNLNTHTPAALYAAFPPAEARRLARKLEFHHTPPHGSWLNMAEIELSVLGGQCLDRRLGDRRTLEAEAVAWADRRNAARATITWRFTTADARLKLHRVYPAHP